MKLFLLAVAFASSMVSVAGATTEIRGYVFPSGGGKSTSLNHSLYYTIGESVVGRGTTTNHEIRSAFWGASPHATAVNPDLALPVADQLYQNFPNPFNPTTTIQYDLSGNPGHVSLRVYDVAGHLVRTLVDEVQSSGTQSATWDGRNSSGSFVATGIYLYVLETPRTRFTRKMVLLQ